MGIELNANQTNWTQTLFLVKTNWTKRTQICCNHDCRTWYICIITLNYVSTTCVSTGFIQHGWWRTSVYFHAECEIPAGGQLCLFVWCVRTSFVIKSLCLYVILSLWINTNTDGHWLVQRHRVSEWVFHTTSDFDIRSRISPEWVKISKIIKRIDREWFLPHSTKKSGELWSTNYRVSKWVGFNGTSTQLRSLVPNMTQKAGTESPTVKESRCCINLANTFPDASVQIMYFCI